MQISRGKVFVLALAMAATFAACRGKPPTSPTPAPGTPPAAVSITRLELTGPGTVHLGQTAQFTAIAQQSDGTTRDVTRDASWSSFNPSLLLLAAPGQFTGRAKGQTGVRVSMSGRSATIGEVIIVPEGTFRLNGAVRDAGVPVEALVRIEDGAIGRTDVQTIAGKYVVFGVNGHTRVTVIKSGYQQETKRQVLASHAPRRCDAGPARRHRGRGIANGECAPEHPSVA